MRVALVVNRVTGDIDANMALILEMAGQAADAEADPVLLTHRA